MPFQHAPRVKEIVNTIVLDYTSIMQRPRKSADLRDIFAMNTSKMELDVLTSKGVDNLSSALHRFDSIVNPCSRWCVLFGPVASHADQVATLRRGQEEGKDAERYLIYVADVEGLFRCLP